MVPMKCRNCPLRKREVFSPIDGKELAFMERFKSGELVVDPKTDILLEGARSPQLFTVYSGMGVRYKTLEDGGRQVINFVLPGDFIGLQAGVLTEMKHSVASTTTMTLCVFQRTALWGLFENHPERAFDLTWLAAREEHFLGETLATIGQRSGLQRIAWGLLQVFRRGLDLGLVKGDSMILPYTQHDLADALGLSLVHTNKTLKNLKNSKAAQWVDGKLTVPDVAALAELANTDVPEKTPRPLF